MFNITMCSSNNCPKMDTCYRIQKECNPLSSTYYNFEYTCNANNGFQDYILFTKEKNNESNKEGLYGSRIQQG